MALHGVAGHSSSHPDVVPCNCIKTLFVVCVQVLYAWPNMGTWGEGDTGMETWGHLGTEVVGRIVCILL